MCRIHILAKVSAQVSKAKQSREEIVGVFSSAHLDFIYFSVHFHIALPGVSLVLFLQHVSCLDSVPFVLTPFRSEWVRDAREFSVRQEVEYTVQLVVGFDKLLLQFLK